MAGLLETLAVPRASGFPTASLSPIACSSVFAFSGRRESVALPQSRGLKIQSVKSTRSLISSSRHGRRGGLIVCQARGTAVEVTAVTDKTWQSLVLEADVPVMVEFWAPWCGPCRMITPIIDELAKQYQGKLNSYKLNTDECPKIASNYGIRSIPTVMIFKGGEKKEAVIGAVPKSTLETSIEKFL